MAIEVEAQDPVKAQDPQPAKKPPETMKFGDEAAETVAPQRPQEPLQAINTEPPPDFEERMMRLMKAKADAFQMPFMDDRGRVIEDALPPEQALRRAMDHFGTYMKLPGGADAIREYLHGGKIPADWVPPSGIVKSPETYRYEMLLELAEKGREESPVSAALYDYVVDPAGNIVSGALQIGANVVVGGLNIAGAQQDGKPLPQIDVKAKLYGLGESDVSKGFGSTREILDAMSASRSTPAKVLNVGAELGGAAVGFGAGIVGKGLGLAGKAGGFAGKLLGGSTGKVVGHGAGLFATYEGIAAEPGKRVEAIAYGATAGAALGVAQKFASLMLRGLFHAPVKALGKDGEAVMESLKGWAEKNELFRDVGESATAYGKRLIDTWIQAGLPGAPKMQTRKFIGYAIKGGADAVGFTALDHEFWTDLHDAAINGNTKKWESVFTKFAGNALGATMLHMRLREIVPWQRRQDPIEPTGKAPKTDVPLQDQPPAPNDVWLRLEGQAKERAEKPAQAETEVARPEPRVDPGTLKPVPTEKVVVDPATGTQMKRQVLDLSRYGWEPDAAKPADRTVPGTSHRIEIEGETAKLSRATQRALGLPETMPAVEAVEAVRTGSLLSALQAKAELPGMEISAEGVKAEAGRGEQPGTMRRVVLGEVQESPVAMPPKWKAAESVPPRGKDALEPEQHQAVEGLRMILDRREDLTPTDRLLLNRSAEVLDTVAERNDQSVKETLDALPKMIETIAAGSPEQASQAIKALAESLTVKTPEKAMQGGEPGPSGVEPTGDVPRGTSEPSGARKAAIESARAQSEQATLALEAIGPEPVKPSSEKKAFGTLGREGASPEAVARFDAEVKAHASWRRKYLKLKKAQVEASNQLLRLEQEGREGELGGVDRQIVEQAARGAVEVIETGAGGAAEGARRLWDSFAGSLIRDVEVAGMPEIAELGRKGTTNTKDYRARADAAGVAELRRTPRRDLESMEDLGVPDAFGGYADVNLRAMDAGAARHFGGPGLLTQTQQRLVELQREVHMETGRIAEELGIQTTDTKGENPRPFQAGAPVLVREYTREASWARQHRTGPIYEAMMRWLEGTYGWTRDQADARWTDAKTITNLDATEVRRSIPAMPSHLNVPGHARPVRILETRPKEHAERLAFRNSQVMGARSVLPQVTEKPPEGTPPREIGDPLLEPLPPAASALVDRVLREHGPQQAQVVVDMVRAMHGMRIRSDWMDKIDPSSKLYRLGRLINASFGLMKSGMLTLSFLPNLTEPKANIPYFGTAALGRGYARALEALSKGEFADVHRQAVVDGYVADTKINRPLHGQDWVETYENMLGKVGDALTSPLRATQDLNEMVHYFAAKERLDAMRAGEGAHYDFSALKRVGFGDAEARAMMRGEGTPEQYDRYRANIIGSLVGGKSQAPAEKSRLAQSRTFNRLVWFTNFFQARAAAVTQLARDIGQAESPQARTAAFAKLLQFAGLTVAAGAASKLLREFLSGGAEGMGDYIRETTQQDGLDMAGDLLGLFAGGVVGGAGYPLVAAAEAVTEPGDPRSKIGQAAIRAIGPLSAGIEFAQFIRAIAGADVPGYETEEGVLDKTGKYLRNAVPAARAIHEGLFGIGALAITEKDPSLDAAMDSFYRWRRENKPIGGDFPREEETREWRDSMRKVAEMVMAGKKWTDQELVDAVVDAQAAKMQQVTGEGKPVSYREARAEVAAGLRRRKMLPDPKSRSFSPAQIESLQRHLGEKHIETLRAWDRTLDMLAKRVSATNLRAAAEQR